MNPGGARFLHLTEYRPACDGHGPLCSRYRCSSHWVTLPGAALTTHPILQPRLRIIRATLTPALCLHDMLRGDLYLHPQSLYGSIWVLTGAGSEIPVVATSDVFYLPVCVSCKFTHAYSMLSPTLPFLAPNIFYTRSRTSGPFTFLFVVHN